MFSEQLLTPLVARRVSQPNGSQQRSDLPLEEVPTIRLGGAPLRHSNPCLLG